MIKAIVVILMFTVLSAEFTPKWSDCGDSSDSWHPTSVTMTNPPAHGQTDTLTLCGEAIDNFQMVAFEYKVSMLNIVLHTGEDPIRPPQNATAGQITCTTFNLTVPNFIIGTIECQFQGLDAQGNSRGCLSLDVTL